MKPAQTRNAKARCSRVCFSAENGKKIELSGGFRFFDRRRGFGLQRLAHQITRKTPDHDVLTQRGNLGRDQFFHGLIRILDEPCSIRQTVL